MINAPVTATLKEGARSPVVGSAMWCRQARSMVVFRPVSSLPSTYTAFGGCSKFSRGVPPISTPTHTAATGLWMTKSFQSLYSKHGICVHDRGVSLHSRRNRLPTTKVNAAPSWYALLQSVPKLLMFLPL